MIAFVISVLLQAQPGATPAPKEGNWLKRHEGFVAAAKTKADCGLLFLGDSITDGWSGKKAIFEAAFGAHKPFNLGVSGDRTQHVLWRIQNGEIDGLKPKAAVIMIGTNNIGQKDNPEPAGSAIAGIQAIVAHLKKATPETKILLLGVFPRGEKPDHALRAVIQEINAAAAKIEGVRFLDIGDKFLQPDKSIAKEIMPDFLHLSEKGYQIWADAIKGEVEGLMK